MKFKIGQKVACIGLPPKLIQAALHINLHIPKAGRVYTIRGSGYFPNDTAGLPLSGNGYLLEEIVNAPVCYSYTLREMMEGHFPEEYFRPIVTTSIAMEQLLKLQDPANHQKFRVLHILDPERRKKEKVS